MTGTLLHREDVTRPSETGRWGQWGLVSDLRPPCSHSPSGTVGADRTDDGTTADAPTLDFRGELRGEVEGSESGPDRDTDGGVWGYLRETERKERRRETGVTGLSGPPGPRIRRRGTNVPGSLTAGRTRGPG